jgi:hypothetical protein
MLKLSASSCFKIVLKLCIHARFTPKHLISYVLYNFMSSRDILSQVVG